MTAVPAEAIPAELRSRDQWLVWRLVSRNGKTTKVPYQARNPRLNAKTDDPSTWASFEDAVRASAAKDISGVGFVLAAGDDYACIDLDHVRDPITGEVTEAALELVRDFDSYTEISQSQTGLHIFIKAKLPAGRRRNVERQVEIYDDVRYIAITGDHFEGTPQAVNERQELAAALVASLGPEEKPPAPRQPVSSSEDDSELLRRMFASQSGKEISSLYRGVHPDGKASEADMALCCHLAWWTGKDAARMDRMFRQSGLMRPKWDERRGQETYGQLTIRHAIETTQGQYEPRPAVARNAPATRPATDDELVEEAEGLAAPGLLENSIGQADFIDAGDENTERVSRKAWAALMKWNVPPRLFVYAAAPVRIEQGLSGSQLGLLTREKLRHELARSAVWMKAKRKGGIEQWEDARPPKEVVEDMLAYPAFPFPPCERITHAPIFGPDGHLHDAPGYSEASKAYYEPAKGLAIPPVSDEPTAQEAAQARSLILDDLLVDFPFVTNADRAHAVALLLLPFVRDLIAGPTPLHVVEKPSPGTGASLMVEAITQVFTGKYVAPLTEVTGEDEWKKTILGHLQSAPEFFILDNLTKRLSSGALSAVILGDEFSGRPPYSPFTLTLRVRCAFIATGNNPTFTPDIARRAVRIRLDAKTDRPMDRRGFKHPNLHQWKDSHRGELIWAALTLVKRWAVMGWQMKTDAVKGSLQRWAEIMGGILAANDIPGFLENDRELYEAADTETAAWRAFVETWFSQSGEETVAVSSLYDLWRSQDFDINLGDGSERSQRTRLGKALGTMRDRQFGAYRIVDRGTKQGARFWALEDQP